MVLPKTRVGWRRFLLFAYKNTPPPPQPLLDDDDELVAMERDKVRALIEAATPVPPPQNNYNWLLVPAFYFVLGAVLATPSLAINYFALQVLHIDAGDYSRLYGFVASPWFVKPVFGFVSDTYAVRGRHRKPYLLVCAAAHFSVWLALAVPSVVSRSFWGFGALMFAANVFLCFADVIADCLLVRVARAQMQTAKGRAQTVAWFARHSGSLCGILLGGALVTNFHSLHVAFAVTCAWPLLLFVGALFVHDEPQPAAAAAAIGEERTDYVYLVRYKVGVAVKRVTRSRLWLACVVACVLDAVVLACRYRLLSVTLWMVLAFSVVRRCESLLPDKLRMALQNARDDPRRINLAYFLFTVASTPSSGQTFSFYLIEELHFSKAFMAWLSIVSVLASLVGLALYQALATRGGVQRTVRLYAAAAGAVLSAIVVIALRGANTSVHTTCAVLFVAAALCALGVYAVFTVRASTRQIIVASIVVATALACTPLLLVTGESRRMGIDDRYFVLGDDVAEAFSSQLIMLPIMVTIAELCPDGGEGLVYAGFMSISNVGSALSSFYGGELTKALGITTQRYERMWALILVCVLCNMLPLTLLRLLPDTERATTTTTTT